MEPAMKRSDELCTLKNAKAGEDQKIFKNIVLYSSFFSQTKWTPCYALESERKMSVMYISGNDRLIYFANMTCAG